MNYVDEINRRVQRCEARDFPLPRDILNLHNFCHGPASKRYQDLTAFVEGLRDLGAQDFHVFDRLQITQDIVDEQGTLGWVLHEALNKLESLN